MSEDMHVRLSTDSHRFHVLGGETRGRDHIYNMVTRWPGWKRLPQPGKLGERLTSIYSAPVSPLTASTLSIAPFELQWTEEARARALAEIKALTDCRASLQSKPPWVFNTLPTERVPMNHQSQAIEAIFHLKGLTLLGDDMGLGKTATSLWALNELRQRRIMVVCPASVKFNWAREIKETLGWHTWVIDGTPKRRANVIADAIYNLGRREDLHWEGMQGMCVVINYDLLAHLPENQLNWLTSYCVDGGLILDESHYVKNRTTTRTKLVTALSRMTKHRLLLTGTPQRNMVDDLYSQAEIIRPGTWVSYWDFAKRHLVMRTMELSTHTVRNKIVGSKDVNGLNAVMNTMLIRRIKEDVLDLPPKIHTYPELELEGDHKKVYKAMKDLAIIQLDQLADGLSIFSPQARSGVEAALRCEQIAMGFVGGVPEMLVNRLAKILSKKAETIPGRPREVIFPDSPKLLWLRENLDTLFLTGKRPVVYSRFNAPLHWLYAHYVGAGKTVGFLHGALTSKHKGEIVADFQDSKFDMMLCQVKMAEGWNAHNSQDCIFLGRDWSPAINHQAEDRLYRIGQKGTVNIQIPIVRGTIEVAIHKKLMAKDADAEQALRTVTIAELKKAL